VNKTGSSKHKAVNLYTRERRWVAKITADGGTKTLRCFTDETHAARPYAFAAKKHYGDFLSLNFPD
jgi:hypothetical protein